MATRAGRSKLSVFDTVVRGRLPVDVRILGEGPQPGHWIGGRYLLRGPAVTGHPARAFSAQTRGQPARTVIVNFFERAIGEDRELLDVFTSEILAARSIESDHVVRVLDQGVELGLPYVVTEDWTGPTLQQRLAEHGPMAMREVERLIGQLALGLEALHERGHVHRHLRPSHVVLTPFVAKLKLCLARVTIETLELARSLESHRRALSPTAAYMSPEQVLGRQELDARSDLWSLAIIACECLTGVRPFSAETPGEELVRICTATPPPPSRFGAVPPAFDAWFARAVQRDPARRFASARELANALTTALAS